MRSVRRLTNFISPLVVLIVVLILILVACCLPHLKRLAEGFADCPASCLKCSTEPGYLESHGVECDSCAKSCPTQRVAVGAAGPRAEPRESENGY